jgi:hypothetical protein
MSEEQDGVTSLVFSPQASRESENLILVSTSINSTAFVWDIDSDATKTIPKYILEGHTDWLRGAAVSRKGRFVATASDDRTVQIWDLHAADASRKATGDGWSDTFHVGRECVAVFQGHNAYIFSVAFSNDGTRLASAGDDFHVMIWNLAGDDGRQADKEKPDKDMYDLRVPNMRGAVFSPNDRSLLTVCEDGSVAFWDPDLAQGQQCRLVVNSSWSPDIFNFKSMRIDAQHPNVLLTEFGAWPFDIGEAALQKTMSRSTSLASVDADEEPLLPRHQAAPAWSPFGIDLSRQWITWDGRKLIFLPKQFRAADNVYHVQEHSVVVGCGSGHVLLFRFKEDVDPAVLSRACDAVSTMK